MKYLLLLGDAIGGISGPLEPNPNYELIFLVVAGFILAFGILAYIVNIIIKKYNKKDK